MKNDPNINCRLLALLAFLFLGFANANSAWAQESIPDTPAANRFKHLLKIINESDDETRKQLIDESFDDSDKELESVYKAAKQLHAMSGGVAFQKETVNTESEYGGACLSKRGATLVISVEIAGEKDLIADVTVERYEDEGDLEPFGDFFPVIVDGKTNPKSRGVWLAKGYGYVLEITDEEMKTYNYSGNFGWQIEFYDNLLFSPGDTADTAQVTLHALEPGYSLTRLAELPAACKKKEWTPTELFDAFADVFTVHYPFFEQRNVDWSARIKKYRPTISDESSESELFEAMAGMLRDLQDGHVSFEAEIDGKNVSADVGRKGTSAKLHAAFKNQTETTSKNAFLGQFITKLKDEIRSEVLGGNGQSECNDKLIWGRTHDRVGYIYISAMYGYGSGSLSEQTKSLHEGMNKILGELADTDALIIDISMNPGGTDAISVELATHFADERRLGFSKWPAAAKEYRNDRYVVPFSESEEKGVVYTKPVYLLHNDFSASAAEIFTMCMRAFPQVTTLGQPTEGALSDILGKPLPNEWELGISNEVYVDHEGICHEGPGIPPQIEMEVFGADIMNHDHNGLIQKIVKLVLEKQKK